MIFAADATGNFRVAFSHISTSESRRWSRALAATCVSPSAITTVEIIKSNEVWMQNNWLGQLPSPRRQQLQLQLLLLLLRPNGLSWSGHPRAVLLQPSRPP
jgi:hypothetical protein